MNSFNHRFLLELTKTRSNGTLSVDPVIDNYAASTAIDQKGYNDVFRYYTHRRSPAESALVAEYGRPHGHDAAASRHRQESQFGSRQSVELLHLAVAQRPRQRPQRAARLDRPGDTDARRRQ